MRYRCAALFLPLLLAAAPATRPAVKAVDRNTTEYTSDTAKVSFRVPKTWVRQDRPGVDPQQMFAFDAAPQKKLVGVQFLQHVTVYLAPATEKQKTLEDVVPDARETIRKMQPGVKFAKDAAVTYAGRPAHTFHFSFGRQLRYDDGTGTIRTSEYWADRVETVFLDRGTVCQIGLIADPKFMPSLTTKVLPVAKSLTWAQ